MLFVLFKVDDDPYAIASTQIEVILPYARLKALPRIHPALAGLLNFHGHPVPVLDLHLLLGSRPSQARFHTRLILCKNALANAPGRLLGLIAEHATQTRQIPEDQFRHPGASSAEARFAGKIFEDSNGRFIQWIHPARILPAQIAAALTRLAEEAA